MARGGFCGRPDGHGGQCNSPVSLERKREHKRELRRDTEYRERELRKNQAWKAANPLRVYLNHQTEMIVQRQARMEALTNG
jgi:hypothetical protein